MSVQGTSETQRDKGDWLFVDIKPNLGLRVFLPQVVPVSLTINKRGPECLAVEKGSFLAGCSAACLT